MNPLNRLRSRTGINWPTVLLVLLLLAVFVGVLVAASTSTAAFDPMNPSWEGTGEFNADISNSAADRELIRNTEQYNDVGANESVAFIIAPDSEYSDTDIERVRQFIVDGGTVVILGNFEPATNELLSELGTEARLNGRLLLDQESYSNGPAMPIATDVRNQSQTAGVDELGLNHATAVEPGNATILAGTSEFAYLGDTPDDELDDDTDLRNYPVATTESLAAGEVVVVGDPSITINSMYDESDNAAFLTQQYAGSEDALVDISHTNELPPLTGAMLTIRSMPPLQGVIGIGLVAVIGLLVSGTLPSLVRQVPPRLSRSPKSVVREDSRGLTTVDRTAYLRRKHPEWDEDRIQRVIRALNTTDSKRDTNERDRTDKSKR